MDRRGFLRTLVGGVAAGAAVRSWPFRVFSFPTDIVAPPTALALENTLPHMATVYYNREALEMLKKHLQFRSVVPARNGNYYAVVHPLQFREYVMSGVSN